MEDISDINNNIRSDMWNEMSFPQLEIQRDLVHANLNHLYPYVVDGSIVSARGMYTALLHALDVLNEMIEARTK